MAEKDQKMPACLDKSPGPAAYLLPPLVGYKGHAVNKNRGPNFTMRMRTTEFKDTSGPGPEYNVRGISRYGKEVFPNFSLRKRAPPKKLEDMPGPNSYSPEKFPYPKYNNPPAYSIRFPLKGMKKGQIPGPNEYLIPTCIGPRRPHVTSMPEYSMRPRIDPLKKAPTPGPPDYGVPNESQTRQRPPALKMMKRCGVRAVPDSSKSPAPIDYYPQYNTSANAPKTGFGIRHGPCAPPYITPLDNAQFL